MESESAWRISALLCAVLFFSMASLGPFVTTAVAAPRPSHSASLTQQPQKGALGCAPGQRCAPGNPSGSAASLPHRVELGILLVPLLALTVLYFRRRATELSRSGPASLRPSSGLR